MEISKAKIVRLSLRILPIVLGAAGGFLYYTYIGCVSGTCPITSNPWLSTGYGALIGLVFISLGPTRKKI
jgi:hypothetical protein